MELITFEKYLEMYSYPLAVTIGSFDGIHLGHQALIKNTYNIARRKGYKSAVLTFDPHPLTVVNKSQRENITSIDDKFDIIEKFKVDFLIIINFSEKFQTISKTEFINNYLLKINVKEVVVGDDFKFGYKGEGKALEISSLSNNLINTNIINLIMMDDEKIGSTKILQLLKEGKIETVNKLLGYNYYFNGSVVKGKQVGRRLGFPTANINNNNVKNLLKTGVYGVFVYVDDCSYLGMMNLGHNPTCNFTNELSLEINLFDVDKDLYDKNLKIEIFCYVREEKKFSSRDDLISQLKKDQTYIINKNHMLAKK